MTSTEGRSYTGKWARGKQNGSGVMVWPTGDRYDGKWRDNMCHGQGKMTITEESRKKDLYKKLPMHLAKRVVYQEADSWELEGLWEENLLKYTNEALAEREKKREQEEAKDATRQAKEATKEAAKPNKIRKLDPRCPNFESLEIIDKRSKKE